MRRKIVAGNWKMNTLPSEGVELAKAINEKLKNFDTNDVKVAIAPPFTHLSEVAKVIDSDKITVASQNCAENEKGAFTGEISAAMLKNIGVNAVILGHSERRAYYGETSETLNNKVAQVLANGQEIIYCIGEVLEEREAEKHFDVVKSQLQEVVFKLSAEDFKKVILAYEPVWAIGTGKTASPAQAQEMHAFIRSQVAENYNQEVADNTTIQYGGSCNPKNAKELFSQPDVDGGLIGGAALNADNFYAIITSF